MAGFEEIESRFDTIKDEVQAASSRFAELLVENNAYKTALADCRRELEAMRKTLADVVQESAERTEKAGKATQAIYSLTASLERAQEKHRIWRDGFRRLDEIQAKKPNSEIGEILGAVQLVVSGEPDAVEIGEADLLSRIRLEGNPHVFRSDDDFRKSGAFYLHDEDFTRRGLDVGGKRAQKIEGFAHKQ